MSLESLVESGDAGSAKGNGSRFNAVKHGLTAKTAVLPGEDPEAFQAKVSIFKEGLDTRNEFEEELAKGAAMASWQLERANHSEVARLSRDILTGAEADVRREEEEVLALGNRLFFDRRGPIELYPSGEYTNSKQPRTSASGTADDPDDPAKIVLGLESTVAGCRWLLEAWKRLRDVLESGLAWQPHEKIKAIRLLGKQPLDAFSDRDVALVFIASHAIEPEYSHAFYELRCEIDEDSFKRHKARLGRWSRRGIAFADAAAAREALVLLVEKATERLRVIENQRKQVALKIGELRTDILSFDESKTGEQLRRHLGAAIGCCFEMLRPSGSCTAIKRRGGGGRDRSANGGSRRKNLPARSSMTGWSWTNKGPFGVWASTSKPGWRAMTRSWGMGCRVRGGRSSMKSFRPCRITPGGSRTRSGGRRKTGVRRRRIRRVRSRVPARLATFP